MRLARKNIIGGLGILSILFLVGVLFGFTRGALADEPMPEPVLFALKAIQNNQAYIAENRAIVEEFERRKSNNATQIGVLQAYGYAYSWDTGTADKVDFQ
jgi:hypothetical protein